MRGFRQMRAVLDVGTNSVRLLVAKVSQGKVEPLTREVKVTRLGQGVDERRRLDPVAMGRTLAALSELTALIPKGAPISIMGTSAVRDAQNGKEFAELVKMETGLSLQILSGLEEAELSFKGAVFSLQDLHLPDPVTVVDIGGGSTEVYTGTRGGTLLGGGSAQVGAVRLLEKGESSDLSIDLSLLEPVVQENLKFSPKTLVAVGGTATSLAAMIQDLQEYSDEKVTGFFCSLEELKKCYRKLGRLSLEERRHIPSLQAGREDVIVYGAAILIRVVELMGISQFYTSSGDLLYGWLWRQDS
ncbi:MAG TPA: phosphatase [Firmicutes bacterium]|nr:phosphatase [Bacillota bacterium]